MFTQKDVMFLYAVSPVHMGSGTAIGSIDNPVQRERHTGHPVLAGSGLKGALRDAWENGNGANGRLAVDEVFGPETTSGDAHAGALAVADGEIVLFPVRSLKGAYVYATCPLAIARLQRKLSLVGKGNELPSIPVLDDTTALVTQEANDILVRAPAGQNQRQGQPAPQPQGNPQGEQKLVLEAFAFRAKTDPNVGALASKLASWLPPQAQKTFKEKVAKHIVVLSDTRFAFFVKNATVVEPHVRIDDITGTADEGGLFYTENVPPESLFASLIMVSKSRKGNNGPDAATILDDIRTKFGKVAPLLQVGGDATTGRGQMLLSFVGQHAG